MAPTSNSHQQLRSRTGAEAADQLRWMRRHRLMGVMDLLAKRGIMSAEARNMTQPLAKRYGRVAPRQLAMETKVVETMISGRVRALVLKGLLLAHSVYPEPEQRLRVDMDILVPPQDLQSARQLIHSIGYRPLYQSPGGTPIPQEAWVRDADGYRHMIDVHWKLRNHPCLRDRLGFDEQWQDRVPLPSLAEGACGQSAPHALLNASMHWFDNVYSLNYPLVWILDKDLLWRSMDEDERQKTIALATDRGLAGLLAESLRLARHHFETPVGEDTIATLDAAGRGRRPTRLIALQNRRMRSWLYALHCEPGLNGKWHRLRHALFPPAAYLRERYPEGSALGVAGLWGRRIKERLMGRRVNG